MSNQDILDPKDIGTIKRPKSITKKVEQKSMKKPIIFTVVITLAVVAAFVATFITGMNYANSLHADREAAVKAATSPKAQAPQNQ